VCECDSKCEYTSGLAVLFLTQNPLNDYENSWQPAHNDLSELLGNCHRSRPNNFQVVFLALKNRLQFPNVLDGVLKTAQWFKNENNKILIVG